MSKSFLDKLIFSVIALFWIGCSGPSKKDSFPEPYHEDLNTSFSRDSSAVYYDGNVINSADPFSFVALDKNYGKDREHVFFCDWNIGGQSIFTLEKKETITEVVGAIPKTFVSLGFFFAKDSLHAYFKGTRMKVKHLSTFRALDLNFSRDTLQAYFNQRPIIGSDGATFQIVDSPFTKDKKFVYFYFYDENSNDQFIKIVRGAKPDSFQPVDGWFSKDAGSVYYRDKKITGADPHTIETIGDWHTNRFSRDSNSVFFEDKKIDGADRSKFAVCPQGENALKFFYFGRDNNSVFWQTKKVVGADPNSFVVLGMGYGKDNQHIYYGTTIVEGAHPKTFQTRPHDGDATDAKDANGDFLAGKRRKD